MSDTCLLYACYRGHGKVIDRSDWLADFRRALQRAGTEQASQGHCESSGNRSSPSAAGDDRHVKRRAPDTDTANYEAVMPSAGDLRARFDHATKELSLMGYVKAYKRRRRDDGDRQAFTRLVYAYTMEG